MYERLICRQENPRASFSWWIAIGETPDFWLAVRRNCEGYVETQVHAIPKGDYYIDCSELL